MKKISKLQNRHISAWARQVLFNAQSAEYHALANANRSGMRNAINNVVAQCKYIIGFLV